VFVDAVLHLANDKALDGKIVEGRSFTKVWLESVELQKVLNSPAVLPSERRAVIAHLCTRLKIGEQTRNLLFILSDRYLLYNYPAAIVDAIEVHCDQRRGIEQVYITSSRERGREESASLKVQIESHRKSEIRLICFVDPSLLGGVRYANRVHGVG
jgi:F0F1-type ATP synthase delta subunit